MHTLTHLFLRNTTFARLPGCTSMDPPSAWYPGIDPRPCYSPASPAYSLLTHTPTPHARYAVYHKYSTHPPSPPSSWHQASGCGTRGHVPAVSVEACTCLTHAAPRPPLPLQIASLGTHTAPAPLAGSRRPPFPAVADTRTPLAPLASTTGWGHLHLQSESSSWYPAY